MGTILVRSQGHHKSLRPILSITLAVLALVLLLASLVEFIRCRSHRLGGVIQESDLTTLQRVEAKFGVPDSRWPAKGTEVAGRLIGDVRIPAKIAEEVGAEPLLVSVWERHCFVIASSRFVVISRRRDGRVLVANGGSRFLFDVLMVRSDDPTGAGPPSTSETRHP